MSGSLKNECEKTHFFAKHIFCQNESEVIRDNWYFLKKGAFISAQDC